MTYRVGVLGARGYVGKELIEGILLHPDLSLDWVSSRQLAGQKLPALVPNTNYNLIIENLDAQQVAAKNSDVIVLALPNGLAADYVAEIEKANTAKVLIDLSADYRFTSDWIYSVPELHSDKFKQSSGIIKISNPGCYATAMQVAIAPIKFRVHGTVNCYGISGYSGAGTKPSPNNDPQRLKDNILPYALVEHIHEQEVILHSECDIHFSPHVAAFFRGINMTVQWRANGPQNKNELLEQFNAYYEQSKYIECQMDIPNIKQVVHTPNCIIGGFTVSDDGMRITQVSVIDNLAKGAASQAMQNINIALGLEEHLGIDELYSNFSQTHSQEQ